MKLLAFDTSTEAMSVAVTDGVRTWQHSGEGGAKSSAALLPAILGLLQDAGFALWQLDAIAFGCGPGSFTGLRTACSVAQGLAYGASARRSEGVPVLPVDTLLAVAEEARLIGGATQVIALLDARMDEVYMGRYQYGQDRWTRDGDFDLVKPEDVQVPPGWTLAGNALTVYGERIAMPAGGSNASIAVLPTAAAMLRLAPALLAAGEAVAARDALPRYIRDKVARTTVERAADKLLAADKAIATDKVIASRQNADIEATKPAP